MGKKRLLGPETFKNRGSVLWLKINWSNWKFISQFLQPIHSRCLRLRRLKKWHSIDLIIKDSISKTRPPCPSNVENGQLAASLSHFYRTRVLSLGMLVTHWLTDSLTDSVSLTFVQTLTTLVKILKLKFRGNFETEVWSVFCCWCLVEVTKLNLGQYFEARFGQDFNLLFYSRDANFEVNA